MKRIFAFMFLIVVSGVSAHSASICVEDNAYIGVLYKNVDGTSTAYNNTIKAWKVVFDYKTITGLAACNGISGTRGTPKTNLYTDVSDVGTHCWCKMEPVVDTSAGGLGTTNLTGIASYWVYAYDYATALPNETVSVQENACAGDCTSKCATWISNNANGFRVSLFEAIW